MDNLSNIEAGEIEILGILEVTKVVYKMTNGKTINAIVLHDDDDYYETYEKLVIELNDLTTNNKPFFDITLMDGNNITINANQIVSVEVESLEAEELLKHYKI